MPVGAPSRPWHSVPGGGGPRPPRRAPGSVAPGACDTPASVRSLDSLLNRPCGSTWDYRANAERARINVSLWLRLSPGAIRSSNFTIRGFGFGSFWTFGAFGLDCADAPAIVSLWLA